ncbi:MAG: hypothetical protein QXE27_06090 [Thermoplasmata archaeon]
MPRRKRGETSKGKCSFCGTLCGKSEMLEHLKTCEKRIAANKDLWEKDAFHILVEGLYLPQYWLHIAVASDATLKRVDQFLRGIWLECCGHLSRFIIGGVYYEAFQDEDDKIWAMGLGREARDMEVRVDMVLSKGLSFIHEYDYGTPTRLRLEVVDEYKALAKNQEIRILARNEPPKLKCVVCGAPATRVCSQCKRGTWLCDKCAKNHECGEDSLLPVTNSPRVGVCGYCGPC